MEISSLTIKIIILLIPGLISYFIYKRLTSRPNKRSDLMFISISIFLGMLSYLFLQIADISRCFLGNLFGKTCGYERLETFESLSQTDIPYLEVGAASLFGIVIAYLFAWIDTKNYINKLGVFLKMAVKESDDTLYTIYLSKEEVKAVYIRDSKNNLTYLGKLFSFSEKGNLKEVILEEVSVYLYNEGSLLYTIPSIYLTLGEGVTIEQAPEETQELEDIMDGQTI